MAYQVLARKYRPQRFADVAGQEHVTRTLLNALEQGRIAHGYIFSGHRGIGKTTVARILAMALNCQQAIGSPASPNPERPSPEPCGACDSCTEIRAGNAVDVIEIDAATNRGIDEIRELRDAARYRPARDRYKIYILDEAHQITDAAFNALLKTLEEPPEHVVFMMATTQPEDIPQTIRSRSQHFSFHAVKFADILAELHAIADKEGIAAGEDALALLAEAGDGSMRDALSIMDQAIASAPLADGRPQVDAAEIRELMGTLPNAVFERLLESVSENASSALMEEANRLLNAGNSPSQLARQFVRYLRNCLMARVGGQQTELLQVSDDERARASRTAMLFSEEDLLRFLQVMLRTFDELNYRQEQRFHLELGLLKLVHMQRLIPLEQVLSQLAGASPASARAAAPVPAAAPARPPVPSPGTPRAATAPPQALRPGTPAEPEPRSGGTPFSPFEADSRRKRTPDLSSGVSPGLSPGLDPGSAPLPKASASSPESLPARGVEPLSEAPPTAASALPSITGALAVAELDAPPQALRPEPPEPEILGNMSAEEEWRIAAAEEELASGDADDEQQYPSQPGAAKPASAALPQSSPELDRLRDAVAAALDAGGHNTAAALLAAGRWSLADDTLTAEVAVKKTMLGLTMNPEAERIAKKALGETGAAFKLRILPGEAVPNGQPSASRPASTGSMEAQALENPLVKRAQALFRAEVRSVLDLRDKR